MMISLLKQQKETVSIEELNIGKHNFKAIVNKIEYKTKFDCFGVPIYEPYMHLKDLKFWQDDKYVDIGINTDTIEVKIGKRIAEMKHLEDGDEIGFHAYVKEKTVKFPQEEDGEIVMEEHTERYLKNFSQLANLTQYKNSIADGDK